MNSILVERHQSLALFDFSLSFLSHQTRTCEIFNFMSTLHQYISAIGSFQGIILFILLTTDSRVTAASKVLGLCCLCLGLTFLLPFITSGIAHKALNPLAVWIFFLPVMYAPLIYLYCRKVVFDKPFQATDLIHLLPLCVCYLLNIDALFSYHEEFRLWVVGAPAPTLRVWLSEYLLFGFAIFYTLAAALVIKTYQQQATNTLSNFDSSIFKWLGILIFSFVLIWSTKAVMALTNVATKEMLIISDALIVIVIYLIALAQWRSPKLFNISNISGDELAHSKDSNFEAAGTMDEETHAILFDVLKKQFEQEALYRNSKLTLTKLAELTGISSHHLSEVLNQYVGRNFNHFVNAYRVDEVCERLKSSSSSKVLDIALEAGFSSKSTFNTIFKKYKGVTPTEYRQQLHP